MIAVLTARCEARGVRVLKIGVDTSEFPFAIYGVLENGRDFLAQLNTELRGLSGYAYGGSVTGRLEGDVSYFSLNMVPGSAFPRDQAEAIQRRLMIRLQMLVAAWTEPAALARVP